MMLKVLSLATTTKLNLKSNVVLSICLSLLLSLGFMTSAQTHNAPSADLFPMVTGTQVQILSSNFLTVIANGQIIENRLELHTILTPTQNVQLLFSNAQTGEVGILPAIVGFEGNDLLIPMNNQMGNPNVPSVSYISLRNWLFTTKGITLTTNTANQ